MVAEGRGKGRRTVAECTGEGEGSPGPFLDLKLNHTEMSGRHGPVETLWLPFLLDFFMPPLSSSSLLSSPCFL